MRYLAVVRYLAYIAVHVVILIAGMLPRVGSAQILPLLVESGGASVEFWWSEPETPSQSLFDRILLELTEPLLLDVTELVDLPSVSRIYRVPDLSATSARNLGSVFGVELVLTGRVDVGEAHELVGGVAWVAVCEINYQLLSVDVNLVLSDGHRAFQGLGYDAEMAQDEACSSAAAYLSERLVSRSVAMNMFDPGDQGRPTLIIRGLSRALPLVALEGELRQAVDLVAGVREAWATEAAIAVEIELQHLASMEDLVVRLYAMEAELDREHPFVVEGMQGSTIEIVFVPVDPVPMNPDPIQTIEDVTGE